MTDVLVVCPSVTAAHAERFCAAAASAQRQDDGLRVVLVANSTATQELIDRWPNLVVPGANVGFAASINQGATAGGPFRWLVIANDDMEYDADAFARLARYLREEPADTHRVIRLTHEPWRRMPGLAGVFTNLSLVEKVVYGLGRPLRTEMAAPSQADVYISFGLVAVSAPLWAATAGLEESLPFCYEDALFVRRARALPGGLTLDSHDLGVRHLRSATTTSNVDLVLPVISWSAVVYLQLIGVPGVLARIVCVLALTLRMPLSLVASAGRAKHLRGILLALRAIATGRRPHLPAPGGGTAP